MDAESGRILYAKNASEQMAMASTTKIMTLLVALEQGDLSKKVTVSKYAQSMPDVQLNMKENEQYVLKDLLYSLMLESHNDSAVAVAEGVAGSIEKFADRMNQKAKEIGLIQNLKDLKKEQKKLILVFHLEILICYFQQANKFQ